MTTYKELTELNEGHDWYYEACLWEDQYQVDQYVGLPVYHGTSQFTPVNPVEFITDDEPRRLPDTMLKDEEKTNVK